MKVKALAPKGGFVRLTLLFGSNIAQWANFDPKSTHFSRGYYRVGKVVLSMRKIMISVIIFLESIQ